MPRLRDLEDDTSSVHEYTEASGSLDNSSEDEGDSEETDRSTKQEGSVLPPPRNTTSTLSRDVLLQQQETVLVQAIHQLESPDEVNRSYPPRFSDVVASGAAPSYLPESQILSEFIALERHETNDDDDDEDRFHLQDTFFFEFEVENFCIYQSPEACSGASDRNGLEGRYDSLHVVANYQDNTDWFIDGTLKSAENRRSFIRGAIIDVNIGALENTTQHSAAESIWVQTTESKKKSYWYLLRGPSKAYEPYWSSFLWLADFTKYFIDFLHVNLAAGVSVCLKAFGACFWKWLKELHGTKISEWHRQCGERTDFRHHVLNHAQFLRRRALCLERDPNINNPRLSHQVWDDAGVGEKQQATSPTEKTVVTRHVAYSFLKSCPHWRDEYRLLQVVEKCAEVEAFAEARRRKWKFPNKLQFAQRENFKGRGRHKVSKAAWLLEEAGIENQPIRVHDSRDLLREVIIVRVPLKERNQYDFRYAWVRGVLLSTVSVVWLVLPTDTTCGNSADMTFYPIGNELFFSDECNCKPVSISNVIKIVKASPFTDHAQDGSELFIHGLYRPSQEVHVKATESELSCHCQRTPGGTRKTRTTTRKKPATTRGSAAQSPLPKMKVCALCSGCGLLDHAFCDASLAETVLAVEHDKTAARSHIANNRFEQCEYLIDSVNPVLMRFMTGKKPLPPQIDCIIAGCPCQGWSALNNSKENYESQKNCSILANILSWIEVFMPVYVLIENVPKMEDSRPNACAQAICHLIALGYQVRKSIRVDCDVGGVSIRERLFIIAAAPGASLPAEIPITHHRGRGESEPRTAWSAISDLKPIENDLILNHEDPEHVPLRQLRINWDKDISFRNLVAKIETSLSQAHHAKKLSPRENKFFRGLSEAQQKRSSKVLKRVSHDKPFRTIATTINPMDAWFGGEVVHPFQNRLLSLREIYRAMGVPDGFLLTGTIAQKHKQLGNGVPGALARGWGVEFAKAWTATIQQGGGAAAAEVNGAPSPVIEEVPGLRYSENISKRTRVTTTARGATTGKRKQATFEMTYSAVKTLVRRRARRVIHDSDDEAEEQEDTRHMSRKVTTTRSSLVTTTEESRPAADEDASTPTSRGSPATFNKMVTISSDEEEYWSALDDPKTSWSPSPPKHGVGSPPKPSPQGSTCAREVVTKRTRTVPPCPVPVTVPARPSRKQRTWETGSKREAPLGPGYESDGNDGGNDSDDSDIIYLESRQVKKARV
jgi:site-specific DNA-cytosine methylase